jgi:hypothetical protein
MALNRVPSALGSSGTLVGALLMASLLLPACKKEPPKPDPKEPWLAQPSASAVRVVRGARYRVHSSSRLVLEIKVHGELARIEIPLIRGELTVDTDDLTATQGTLRVDLGTVSVQEPDAGAALRHTEEVKNWLELGVDRPEAERERLRWAEFTVESVRPGGRQDSASVRGALTFHGFRTSVEAPVSLSFPSAGDDPDAAPHSRDDVPPGTTPERIDVEIRPVSLSLETFDVKPRDSHGVVIAARQGEIGKEIARSARVTGRMVLARISQLAP